MGYLVVVLLSVLWLVFFLPSLLQARHSSSPLVSATTFQQSLRRLGEGPAPADRRPVPRVIVRRRVTLASLVVTLGASVVVAETIGGLAAWSVVPATMVLGGYLRVLRLHVARAGRPAREPAVHVLPPEEVVIPSVRRRADVPVMERIAS